MRRVGNQHYTKGFAETIFKEMLLQNANVNRLVQRLLVNCTRSGNMAGSLLPIHSRYLWPFVEDVLTSPVVHSLETALVEQALQHTEFEFLSIDATVKPCLPILGQASHRASAEDRAAAVFDDANSLRKVLTVRGRTNAVLLMSAVTTESTDEIKRALESSFTKGMLEQVRHVATDSPSDKLWRGLH